jgi:hypothetical protein
VGHSPYSCTPFAPKDPAKKYHEHRATTAIIQTFVMFKERGAVVMSKSQARVHYACLVSKFFT